MKLSTSLLVHYKRLDLQVVIDTFYNFISYIKTYQSLVVNGSLELVLTSECNNWRLDREFSKNGFLILHIQDNTGRVSIFNFCSGKDKVTTKRQLSEHWHEE